MMGLYTRIRTFTGGRMVKDIRGTVLIALVGRVCHFFAFVYVARCLGDGLGESTEALGWAQYLQFILTFGLDIVAVRHLASKSADFERLVPRIFTARLVIYGVCSLVWIIGLFFLNLPWYVFQIWLAAVLNLITLGMSFQWVFQGKERMPAFTLIQAFISVGILFSFLMFFHVGDPPEISSEDVANPNAIVLHLNQSSRSIDQWVLNQFSIETKAQMNLQNSSSDSVEEFVDLLVKDLNRLIQGDLLPLSHFDELTFDEETRNIYETHPKGVQVQELNRLVLEKVFDGHIKPMDVGTRPGTDLWVMGICQLIFTTGAWIYIKLHYRVSLFVKHWWRDIGGYISEGLPNWIFGLLYNTLITIGMLSLRRLSVGDDKFANHDDAYATLYRLALAVHFILAFVGSVIYTRIVVWKNERDDFFFRVMLVCIGVLLGGIASCSIIHSMHPILYPFLFQKEVFLPAAPYMSLMLFGRFVGLTSGILVWGMLAYHRDWRAVQCALVPVLGSVLLHFLLVPKFGMSAAVFLNLGGELGLFLFCVIGFMGLRKSVQNSGK